MTIHPSIHLDFARERQPKSTVQADSYRLAQAAQGAATPRLRRVARSLLLRSKTRRTDEPSRARWKTVELPRALREDDAKEAFRELAHRVDGGIDVTLLWSACENRLAVTVFDEHGGELLVLDADSDNALDVFYHPYAHAAPEAAA